MKRSLIVILAGLLILCPFTAFAGKSVTASVSAQNTGTTGVLIKDHGAIRISGGATATVVLQRAENCTNPPTCTDATWVDTSDSWSAATERVVTFTDYSRQVYRLWVKTGGYTTGTAGLWIGSGD